MYLGYFALQLSLLFKLNTFSSLSPFSSGIYNGREKKADQLYVNNYMYIRRFFKDAIYFFCFQNIWNIFQKIFGFTKNLEMTHLVGGGLQAKKFENITHFSDCPCKIILEGKKQAPFVNYYHWITTKKIGICSGTTLRGIISKVIIRHQTEIGFGPSTNIYKNMESIPI